MYPKIQMYIDGQWCAGSAGRVEPILNPATGQPIGDVPCAEIPDLQAAVDAAKKGFQTWRRTPAYARYKLMRAAAENLRNNADQTAHWITAEQGKPLAEARMETLLGADLIDWFAEEARRTYGQVVPARAGNIRQIVVKEPVGPVAAFTPWNFPINQAVRKISSALAAGCSIIVKPAEETPAGCRALVQAFAEAGLPDGVLNMVFGTPSQVSEFLISHPDIAKISFTGSTAVGKQLAALAGTHMKRTTMELGGHAPVIVFEDANVEKAAELLAAAKFRNAGQVCVSPTRFMVHESQYQAFVDRFSDIAQNIKVGNGADPDVTMGPLANPRRLEAIEGFVQDAVTRGATVRTGGSRIGNEGFFFQPTVLTDVPKDARIMNEEPFGPVVPITPFSSFDEAVAEANRLPYGLAAYAYTRSAQTAADIGAAFESGMVAINHHGLALPEIHFGGIKDSGSGSEGGSDAIEGYLNTKLITQASL